MLNMNEWMKLWGLDPKTGLPTLWKLWWPWLDANQLVFRMQVRVGSVPAPVVPAPAAASPAPRASRPGWRCAAAWPLRHACFQALNQPIMPVNKAQTAIVIVVFQHPDRHGRARQTGSRAAS